MEKKSFNPYQQNSIKTFAEKSGRFMRVDFEQKFKLLTFNLNCNNGLN